MTDIELDFDVYGSEARLSCLADLYEASTLLGRSITLAQLDETLADNGLSSRRKGLFLISNEADFGLSTPLGEDFEPTSWSDSLRSMFRQRMKSLGPDYPFEFQRERLRIKQGTDVATDGYCRLLRLSLAHAFDSELEVPPSVVFELLVVSAMSKFGLPSAGVGTAADHASSDFISALQEAGSAVGLSPSDDPRPRRRYAKDGGVDVISALNWRDGRPGQFTWVAQATVGKSGTWEKKLLEPNPKIWGKYLQNGIEPLVFLAVPHHIEDAHYSYLLERERYLVDRLRLASHITALEDGEAEIENWFGRQSAIV